MDKKKYNTEAQGLPSTPENVAEKEFNLNAAPAAENTANRLRLLWDARRFLAKIIAAGAIAGAVIALLLPNHYESSTQLMPSDTQSSSPLAMLATMGSRTAGAMGALPADLLGMKNTGDLFIGILRSRTAEDRLVERFNLKRVYGERLSIAAREKLGGYTAISSDRKSGIITLTVTDTDRKRATALAQAYVEELNHLVVDLSTSAAHRERVFLEERLKAVKLELDQASQEFSRFASKNTAIDIKEQGKAMMDAAALLMGQHIAAQSELKGLEEIYTPNNVRVRTVQARIVELRKQLEKLGGKGLSEATDLPKVGDTVYPSIRKLPLLGVAYGDLYRRTRIQETVFETLTEEYELAKVQEAKEIPSVKVLDIASVPERKSFPPRRLIVLLSMFLCFFGGACWILARSRWDDTSPESPGKVLAQEVFQTLAANTRWAAASFVWIKEFNYPFRRVFTRHTLPAKHGAKASS